MTLVVPIYSSTHQNFRLTLEKKAWNIIYCSTFTGGNQNQIHLSFLCLQIFRISCMADQMIFLLTLIAMRGDTFHSLSFFGSDFVSWIFIKNFTTFLEVKIVINRPNLTAKLIESVESR